MLSHENKTILVAILVLLPLSLVMLRIINDWYSLPLWVAGVVTIFVAVVLPQLYLGYTESGERSMESEKDHR